ncbi:MAG TPA: ATP-binding protein, partial [Syntrophobacteria bacterium]|nr:ATP-binding protein [Syntrophobacteria bacterium]
PGFSVWMEGESLDIGRVLYTAQGKPRVAVFSIAHLGDPERMFFVSLLLNQVVGWMRSQSGTTSLRALVYMDEIFGYFPPVANPPSKQPLLTLLKQARAFGVGVVLATQNPVDLDYKGLANAGTWFIGRLQTERDKARVLDGLEGAAAGAGGRFDRGRMEETLAGLGNRVFLLNNVHEDAPQVFETRWTLSYLRGPLTRNQIKLLMDRAKASAVAPVQTETAPTAKEPPAPPVSPAVRMKSDRQRPVLPPEVSQYFIPLRGARPEQSTLLYRPVLLGSAQVRFTDPKRGIEVTQDVTSLTPVTTEAIPVTWEETREVALSAAELEKEPAGEAEFGELPAAAGKSKSYETWKRDLISWLQRSQVLEMFRSPTMKALSRPGESERDFRLRLQQGGREERDQTVERLRQKYAPKIAALEERIRRAEQTVARESAQVSQQGIQTAISIGATLLGALMGRKAVSTSTLGRATTAMRGAGRVLREREDVGRAQENLAALQQQLADLEGEFKAEADATATSKDPLTEALEPVTVRPTKQNISIRLVALAWAPWWKTGDGEPTPAWEAGLRAR